MNISKNINSEKLFKYYLNNIKYVNINYNHSISNNNLHVKKNFFNILSSEIKNQHLKEIKKKIPIHLKFKSIKIKNNKLTKISDQDIFKISLLIGRNVLVPGSTIKYVKNITTLYGYSLFKDTQSILINIKDLHNHIVFSKQYGPQTSGMYTYFWNGKTNDNKLLDSGIYKLCIEENNSPKSTNVKPLINGFVQSIITSNINQDFKINLGDLGVMNIEDIKKVF